MSTSCTWPIRIGSVALDLKPPDNRAVRAAADKSGDDRRFFDAQRHDVVAAVDQEIEREAERQTEHADDVLDHLVRGLDAQRVIAGGEQRNVVVGQQIAFAQRIESLANGHPEEIRNPGSAILRRRR